MVISCPSPMKRCFITGEQCTNQNNIASARDRNFKAKIASAFVIMAFTDMTNASYNSIIKPEIEEYTKGLFFLQKRATEQTHEIICYKDKDEKDNTLIPIEDVVVERADHDAMFGYIICNRVCQQIQIADIVIVDVSKENPNVFYELGLSVALKKLIIPVCFENDYEKEEFNENKSWKKKLVEYFAIGLSSDKITYNNFNKSLLRYNSSGFIDTNFQEVINNYYEIVKILEKSYIFKGDRIAVLAQNQSFLERDKDNLFKNPTKHNIPDILLFGVNQASHSAEQYMIKPQEQKISSIGSSDARQFLDNYISRQGFLLYTHDPLAENSTEHNIPKELLKIQDAPNQIFNMMIEVLSYAYQIVVDTEDNDVFSLFWLGVAHGFGVYAIRVIRSYTDFEINARKAQILRDQNTEPDSDFHMPRSIFDVSGLWSAELRADKINDFYTQLRNVQLGIARHRKLMPIIKKIDISNLTGKDFNTSDLTDVNKLTDEDLINKLTDILKENVRKNILIDYKSFESYYRRKLWGALLINNKFQIIIGSDSDGNKPPDSSTSRTARIKIGDWDYQSVSLLTEYSLAHNTISKYLIREFTNQAKKEDDNETNVLNEQYKLEDGTLVNHKYYRDFLLYDNIISIGDNTVNPVSREIIRHIVDNYNFDNICMRVQETKIDCTFENAKNNVNAISKRKFVSSSKGVDLKIDWEQPTSGCIGCEDTKCKFNITQKHKSYAQLIILKSTGDKSRPNEEENKEYFEILIGGGAGPATFALTSLLVNEDIKYKRQISKSNDEDIKFEDTKNFLLVKLQEIIRKKILENFKDDIEKFLQRSNIMRKQMQDNDNIINLIVEYTRILLSKFFLPMLYEKDIEGIKKSLQLFIYKMKNNKNKRLLSMNAESLWKNIERSIENVIESFVGIEVIFEVDVSHKTIKKSTGGTSKGDNVSVENRDVNNMAIAKYMPTEDGKAEICSTDNTTDKVKEAVFFISPKYDSHLENVPKSLCKDKEKLYENNCNKG